MTAHRYAWTVTAFRAIASQEVGAAVTTKTVRATRKSRAGR